VALTLLIHCLIAVYLTAPGLSNADLVAQAEAAFHSGMEVRDIPDKAEPLFRQAAQCYETLRHHGVQNSALYANLGNCYLLAGDVPRAILSYRRGMRLAPADPSLRANLTHARERVAYPGRGELAWPPVDNRPPWLLYLSPRVSLPLLIAFYSLGWFGVMRWFMFGRTGPLAVAIGAFILAAVPAVRLLVEEQSQRDETLHPLVVVAADGVGLHKGNGMLYPLRFESPLNRGVEARLRIERGRWLQIELAGGAVGWVPRTAVLLDSP